MSAQLTTIRLYGEMGARFGRVHRLALDTRTPAEAVRALMAMLRGFEAYLMGSKDRGIGFAVFNGKRNLVREELDMPAANVEDIRIAPILMGSKNGGIFEIILGAVLVVVGFVAFGSTSAMGASMIAAGIGAMAGGVAQLLTPVPKGLGSGDKGATLASYNMNGTVNTQAQGNPVPLLYGGPLLVGSAVICAGVDTVDGTYTLASATSGSMGGGSVPAGGTTASSFDAVP